MKIAVVGTGYVGLVSGTCFAETGNEVVCVDIDTAKVEKLRAGEITIYEPKLEKLFERNINDGRLKFTTDLAEAVVGTSVIILALPTPPGEDGSADLQYILGVAAQLGALLDPKEFTLIVDKSTVPVGTAEKVKQAILNNGALEKSFSVVSNPEFLREGVAVDDFMKPDRIVIGASNELAKKMASRLYAPFVRQGNPIIFMDEKSAELTKYAANSYLAMKISFMNEIAQLCERLGADVDMVRHGLGSDDRIGKRFLYPGMGYGGSCFPKDVKALGRSSREAGYDFKILEAVMDVNDAQKLHLLAGIKEYYANDLTGKHFAVWGLSFKPNTDDVREAPALELINAIVKEGASVSAFDPEAMENTKIILGERIQYAASQYDALQGADALIICTEWNEFRTPDFKKVGQALNAKVIFDGRNLFEIEYLERLGYYYNSIGRRTVGKIALKT